MIRNLLRCVLSIKGNSGKLIKVTLEWKMAFFSYVTTLTDNKSSKISQLSLSLPRSH